VAKSYIVATVQQDDILTVISGRSICKRVGIKREILLFFLAPSYIFSEQSLWYWQQFHGIPLHVVYSDWMCLSLCWHTRELCYKIEWFLLKKGSWNTFNGPTVFYNWINRNALYSSRI
jgi:hypothetical protein